MKSGGLISNTDPLKKTEKSAAISSSLPGSTTGASMPRATSEGVRDSMSAAFATYKTGPNFKIIHVIDDNNNSNKNFKCDKDIIVNDLLYFEKYLKNVDG